MTYEEKLRAYIDQAFQGLPDAQEVHDTNELTADLLDHYTQALSEGSEPEQAYEIALSHLGNLAEVTDALDDRPLAAEPPRPPHAPGHPMPPEPPRPPHAPGHPMPPEPPRPPHAPGHPMPPEPPRPKDAPGAPEFPAAPAPADPGSNP